jgi:CheY-like chemotaxis protein
MDMRMPGMSGGEVAQKVWQTHGREALKIVAVSASVLDHERQAYRDQGFDEFLDKLVRAGQLFGCLARLLGVEYEFEDGSPASQPPRDFADVKLPGELHQRLRQAAHTANITRLMKGLDELEGLGDDERQLAGHLRELGLSFAMGQVEEVLRGLGERP